MDIIFFQGQNDLFKGEEQDENKKIEIIKNRINEFFNMKNIHFLFGSGTSSGAIPTMKELFTKVKEQIEQTKEQEIKDEFNEIVGNIDDENLEEILGVLYSHRVYLNNKKDSGKLLICNNLIEIIEGVIFNELNIDFSKVNEEYLNNYKRFYSKVSLRNKDLSRINIFTTNNDLFNEVALDSQNIHYVNGFGGGLGKYFNPSLFNYTYSKRMDTSIDKFEPVENLVYLYKIHGSINWIEDDNNQNSFFKIKEILNPIKGENNVLIYPTPTKQDKSLGSPYVEMFREFQKKLLEPLSVLFVIGYSFSDEHVNNIIYQALATNSTIYVVVFGDLSNKVISKVDDNRIFKIYGETERKEKIHYFEYITKNLIPNMNAFSSENNNLDKFIEFYKKEIEK